ncbi:MAG: hypothetical protein LC114_07420 [Bryobacterales bacterium]|nr:hypothetical protein [Bryobacterales bacterium]
MDFLWSRLQGEHPVEVALGLVRLQEARPNLVSVELIRDRFREHLKSQGESETLKRAVVQLLAEYDPATAALDARRFLDASNSGIMLKASAIATLGLAGGKEDRTLIEPYMTSADIRLSEAAKAALKRMETR